MSEYYLLYSILDKLNNNGQLLIWIFAMLIGFFFLLLVCIIAGNEEILKDIAGLRKEIEELKEEKEAG